MAMVAYLGRHFRLIQEKVGSMSKHPFRCNMQGDDGSEISDAPPLDTLDATAIAEAAKAAIEQASIAVETQINDTNETQVTYNITQNIHDSVISESPVVAPEPTPSAPSGPPPVPAEGLPPGWSMDQWEHYGEQWLSQQEL